MILHATPKSKEMAMKRTPSVPGLVPPCDPDEDEDEDVDVVALAISGRRANARSDATRNLPNSVAPPDMFGLMRSASDSIKFCVRTRQSQFNR